MISYKYISLFRGFDFIGRCPMLGYGALSGLHTSSSKVAIYDSEAATPTAHNDGRSQSVAITSPEGA
jgi:hypothetical protein